MCLYDIQLVASGQKTEDITILFYKIQNFWIELLSSQHLELKKKWNYCYYWIQSLVNAYLSQKKVQVNYIRLWF
jgi:hypothetical protein